MTRLLGLYGAIALLIACLAGAALVYITESERAKRALERAQGHIETRERIDDAIDADRDCPWYDRLQNDCP